VICTRCGFQIMKKQPYARTKKGPHHFRKSDCNRSPIIHVETLWACSCGFKWFASQPPEKCPSCGVHRIEPEPADSAEGKVK
jgi:rubrerythrin